MDELLRPFKPAAKSGNLSGYFTLTRSTMAAGATLRRRLARLRQSRCSRDQTNFHVTFTGVDNFFNSTAATQRDSEPGLIEHLR